MKSRVMKRSCFVCGPRRSRRDAKGRAWCCPVCTRLLRRMAGYRRALAITAKERTPFELGAMVMLRMLRPALLDWHRRNYRVRVKRIRVRAAKP